MLLIIIAILVGLVGVGLLLWSANAPTTVQKTQDKGQEAKKPAVVEPKVPIVEHPKPSSVEEERKKERLELKRLEKTMEMNSEQKKKEREQENLRLAQELEELKKMRAQRRLQKQTPAVATEPKKEEDPTKIEQPVAIDTVPVVESIETNRPDTNEQSTELSNIQHKPTDYLSGDTGDDILTASVVMIDREKLQEQKQGPPITEESTGGGISATKLVQEEEWVMIEQEQDEFSTDAKEVETTED